MAASKAWLFLALLAVSMYFISSNEGSSESSDEVKKEETVEEDGSEVTEDAGILVLTDKNFDNLVNSKKIILIEFYAPWCGHCKALAPEYSQAAQQLKKNDPPVPLAKVDCTTETKLANRFGIQGYPTLKLFVDGKDYDYDGPRIEDGIVKYMKERADPNWKPPPEPVIVLGKDNFTEVTQKEEIMLVEFYAPWCGHCKTLAPELAKAAQTLQKQEKPIVIAKIDATIETDLAQKYGVSGYPTMKIFRKGKESEYKGPREAAGIADYMISHSGLPTTLYATVADVKHFMKSNFDEPVMLGVFDGESDPMYQLFVDANDEVRDEYRFGHTFDKGVKKLLGVKDSVIALIHPEHLTSKYEPRYHFYKDQGGSPTEVQEFYKKHQVPLVGHFQSHTEKRFVKRPLVLVFYDVNFDLEYRSMTQFWRHKVIAVAKDFPDVLFAVVDETSSEERLKTLGLSESGEDVNVGLYDSHDRRYAMVDEEFNEDSLTEFIEAYQKGKLKPIIKSQPVASKAKPGKVQVVVGNSFDDIVMDEKKEVFIEFYAPWCGHCKAIENYIVDLAKKYKNEKDIVIAKIDGTTNEGPGQYRVEGFPTIYYALPGKKDKPILLDGKRDFEALVKFVEDNSEVLKKKKSKEEL